MAKSLTLLLLILILGGCTTRPPAPPASHSHDLPWGALDLSIDSDAKYSIKNSLGTVIANKANSAKNTKEKIPFNILTLTGGGSRGAFGTGFLIGWSEKGNIPNFDIVTGISTGAVMAPFIFLGDGALDQIKYFYTKSNTEDVFVSTWLHFFGYGYIMNANPLKKLFKETFNKDFLDKVAREHKKGRRLYIGTTNIDTGQLTVWDMGAIASSNRADKYERFCDIIYASAALPIYLPPQYIKLDIDGKDYYQMHIDGGIYSQVFMIGLLVDWNKVLDFSKDTNKKFDVTLYTVANRKYRQRDIYKPVKQEPFSIIEAYVLTEMDLLFDRSLYRLYQSCQNKGFKFKMAAIPDKMDAIVTDPTKFNPKQMTELYNLGYKLGYDGIKWKTKIRFDEYDKQF
jgi:hypothetical protein